VLPSPRFTMIWPELLLLKFLLLTYHHSHFFHIFFHNGLLGGCTLFHSWAVFGLDFTSFCNCMLQNWHITINGCCYLSIFLYLGYMQYSICVSCIVFFKCIYFVHVNNYRLIKSKHEAANLSTWWLITQWTLYWMTF